ncbi:tubulin alpha [Paragonimus westermani]|uniref:Tubulin alpha n=1 Tax=Paragonimus westermani TaxID=34504 RepID=A0A5J4P3R8_9TREM|nr:tubulin alpha [Paragonimus westermani]
MLEYGQGQQWVDGGQHEQPDEPTRNGIGQTDEEWQAETPPIEGTGHTRKPREMIILRVGQAGAQLSNATWELLSLEHGIKPYGHLFASLISEDCLNNQTFFQDTPTGQQVSRAVIVDLEPTIMDEIRSGVYHGLFHLDQLVNSTEDASNNYARSFYSVGRRMINRVLAQIRRATEACDMFQGFFVINSFGGGTGSGFI